MNLKQRDIVLLPYPFTDLIRKKVRPAIIISNDEYNKKSIDHIMLPLTSILRKDPFSITINQRNLSDGKLIKTSRIKIDKIFTIEKKLILTKIGTLKEDTFKIIISKVILNISAKK